jgi:hypothetical protein
MLAEDRLDRTDDPGLAADYNPVADLERLLPRAGGRSRRAPARGAARSDRPNSASARQRYGQQPPTTHAGRERGPSPSYLAGGQTQARANPYVLREDRISAPDGIDALGARVIVNTVYDPSDGDDSVGRRELGLSRLATITLRRRLNAVNRGIATLAREHGFLLADLERLFHGHGLASDEPWFVNVIEPNLAGATAIAEHWYELLDNASG